VMIQVSDKSAAVCCNAQKMMSVAANAISTKVRQHAVSKETWRGKGISSTSRDKQTNARTVCTVQLTCIIHFENANSFEAIVEHNIINSSKVSTQKC
jgi:hypothetical protein